VPSKSMPRKKRELRFLSRVWSDEEGDVPMDLQRRALLGP
jgi:hypothetical protein